MRWPVLIANTVLLAGITWMTAVGTEKQAAKLLPAPKPIAGVEMTDLAKLEETASFSPTAGAIADLVTAYLDRDQPGLATAAIERAPGEVQRQPAIKQLHARALFQRGKARAALAMAQEASEECEGNRRCSSWLVAKTSHQVAFFNEVVAAGIEDAYANPGGTKAAYERSTRGVRIAAIW